ncbi:hypothetical protein C8R46DRAFT_1223194 [Mycena filopes]|nr:hypothetical protein C8R46DRAFT_1223194 [Mycena filopes]
MSTTRDSSSMAPEASIAPHPNPVSMVYDVFFESVWDAHPATDASFCLPRPRANLWESFPEHSPDHRAARRRIRQARRFASYFKTTLPRDHADWWRLIEHYTYFLELVPQLGLERAPFWPSQEEGDVKMSNALGGSTAQNPWQLNDDGELVRDGNVEHENVEVAPRPHRRGPHYINIVPPPPGYYEGMVHGGPPSAIRQDTPAAQRAADASSGTTGRVVHVPRTRAIIRMEGGRPVVVREEPIPDTSVSIRATVRSEEDSQERRLRLARDEDHQDRLLRRGLADMHRERRSPAARANTRDYRVGRLTEVYLYLDAARPPLDSEVVPKPHHMCSICQGMKSRPVTFANVDYLVLSYLKAHVDRDTRGHRDRQKHQKAVNAMRRKGRGSSTLESTIRAKL